MGVTSETEVREVTVKAYDLRDEKSADGSVVRIERVVARRGETVRWDAGDRAVSIWFPDVGVFTTPVLAMMHRGAVEATIPADAKPGVYEYSIFDHDARKFVVCESHPKLEIPEP